MLTTNSFPSPAQAGRTRFAEGGSRWIEIGLYSSNDFTLSGRGRTARGAQRTVRNPPDYRDVKRCQKKKPAKLQDDTASRTSRHSSLKLSAGRAKGCRVKHGRTRGSSRASIPGGARLPGATPRAVAEEVVFVGVALLQLEILLDGAGARAELAERPAEIGLAEALLVVFRARARA
jgi:hypothetical protein